MIGSRLAMTAVGGAVLALSVGAASSPVSAEELNALVWCDHTDDALIEPFEKEHGVTVNLKEYEGTGTGISILEQSRPGDWDVFVVDAIDVPRVVELGLLAKMPAGSVPVDDLFEQVRFGDRTVIDGDTYAITEKFGYNTISFNKDAVDAADMMDLSKVWSDKYKGRIAVYDYYLPVIGLAGLSAGINTADLGPGNADQLRSTLFEMKDASALVGGVVASQTALATGEVDIIIGGGEWITAALTAEKPELDWVIPEQGGLLWAQSIGIVEGTEKPDLALKFIQYITSPEGQARLATSSCYWGMPANEKAGAHLTDEQKAALRWSDQAAYLERAQLYPAPTAAFDEQMQDIWAEMLQH